MLNPSSDPTLINQHTAADASYPNGSAQDISAPSAGDGTPWNKLILDDIWGFMQAVVDDAGTTVNGLKETVLFSDFLNSLKILFLQPSALESNGGDIVEVGNRFPTRFIQGFHFATDTAVLLTTQPGSCRSQDDSIDIILTSALQKQLTTAWTLGDGLGGLAEGLTIAADTWYRKFVVLSDDGLTTEIFWDTDPDGANFFGGANAIAADFTTAANIRRIGWTRTDVTPEIAFQHFSTQQNPRLVQREDTRRQTNTGTIPDANNEAVLLDEAAPPLTYVHSNFFAEWGNDAGAHFMHVTSFNQPDDVVNSGNYTIRIPPGTTTSNINRSNSMRGFWLLDSSSQLFIRSDDLTWADSWEFSVEGWEDLALD